jgi:predicted transcriptional regulator
VQDRRASGELEAEVLGVLWAADRPLTPGEVREQVDGDLAYTTVMTILRRLFEKDLLVRERADGGRAFAYAPAVEHADFAADQMHAVLDSGIDRTAVLARFLGRLSPAERRALTSLLGSDRRGRRR